MSFQIHPLSRKNFEHFFDMSEAELKRHKACKMVVQRKPGTPCRISMEDAEVGETVFLLNYQHQTAISPYQSAHAIFIRLNASEAKVEVNEVPEVLRSRLISIRQFDHHGMMIDAEVVNGSDLRDTLMSAFENSTVSYVHLHNAKPGCFAASVTRAA